MATLVPQDSFILENKNPEQMVIALIRAAELLIMGGKSVARGGIAINIDQNGDVSIDSNLVLENGNQPGKLLGEEGAQYALRNPIDLDRAGGYYVRHVCAMTREGLHLKSKIAAELAWRDMEIDRLKAERTVAPVVLPEPVSDEQIKAVFLANGFTIKEGLTDLKPYVYQAARALLATGGQAQANSVIDFPHEEVDALAITRYKVVDADKSMFWESAVVAGDGTRQLYTGRKVECENMARKFAGAFAEGAFVFHAMNAPQAQANCERCKGSGEDPEGYFDQSRGPDGDTHEGPCRTCNGTDAAPQAQADARDAEQERWMGIGKAIERACVDLPAGAEINIHLEKDAGTVTLSDCDGDEQENFPTDEGFAGVVNAAIDAAIAAAKGE